MPIKKTITPEYLISLEDGKQYRTLKRHLAVAGLTPEEYRAKWSLPADYPMVASAYAAKRSELAKKLGLGRKPVAALPAKKTRKANT
ncbi:putative transcriptional regulator [Aminobacter niigataensis]|uniref:Transcriptional regulator n=1 Tax=Aminobacter niigataensis TaxID=83265 RepID=A0ABR6LBG2_9HYPH|nr:putative transcriptional regulator [Aminobacter niigataensis]